MFTGPVHIYLAQGIAVVTGVLLGVWMSSPAELAHKRPVLVVLTPLILLHLTNVLLQRYSASLPGLLGVGVVMMVVYGPVITFLCANGLADFLDQSNWRDMGAAVDLRPIRQLADQDMVEEAVEQLRSQLRERQGHYEAFVYLAKLCAHVNRVEESRLALLDAFGAARLPQQQEFVMRGYLELKRHPLFAGSSPPETIGGPSRSILLRQSLVVFRLPDLEETKSVDAGRHELQRADHPGLHGERWWRIAGSEWGATEVFWDAAARKRAEPGQR
jgi:hypothetical protein